MRGRLEVWGGSLVLESPSRGLYDRERRLSREPQFIIMKTRLHNLPLRPLPQSVCSYSIRSHPIRSHLLRPHLHLLRSNMFSIHLPCSMQASNVQCGTIG